MDSPDGDGTFAAPGDLVLVLAPLGRDAAVVCRVLGAAGIPCAVSGDLGDFTAAIRAACAGGAGGAAVVTEEALTPAGAAELAAVLTDQPPWSDLPVLLLLAASSGAPPEAARRVVTLRAAGNVTVMVRPVPAVVLATTIQSALRARRRQYEVFELIGREHEARLQAERANHLKDEFLANVSHELGTPLAAILLWTRLAAAGRLDATALPEALRLIETSATAQLHLIDDLLDASQMVAGKLRLAVCECQLAPATQAAVAVVKPSADAKGVRVEVVLDPDAGLVLADAERIQQIVWNLLSNAVKFTPPGGSVRVRLHREDRWVRIRIADTGQGIHREFLPHVFDRFRQADTSIHRPRGGLGLGLAICHQLVELHGGTIAAVSSGLDKGAVFTVSLPRVAIGSGETAAEKPYGAIQFF